MDALRNLDGGNLALETPTDPHTGATLKRLDPLEWIHRITAHNGFMAPTRTDAES
jgi:hypothetical protein